MFHVKHSAWTRECSPGPWQNGQAPSRTNRSGNVTGWSGRWRRGIDEAGFEGASGGVVCGDDGSVVGRGSDPGGCSERGTLPHAALIAPCRTRSRSGRSDSRGAGRGTGDGGPSPGRPLPRARRGGSKRPDADSRWVRPGAPQSPGTEGGQRSSTTGIGERVALGVGCGSGIDIRCGEDRRTLLGRARGSGGVTGDGHGASLRRGRWSPKGGRKDAVDDGRCFT